MLLAINRSSSVLSYTWYRPHAYAKLGLLTKPSVKRVQAEGWVSVAITLSFHSLSEALKSSSLARLALPDFPA